MGKEYYGVATAMTGKGPDVVEITHTTAAVNEDSRDDYRIVDDCTFQFPLDLRDKFQIRAAFKRAAEALEKAAKLQRSQTSRPLCIAFGKSSDSQYNFQVGQEFLRNVRTYDAETQMIIMRFILLLNQSFASQSEFVPDSFGSEEARAESRELYEAGEETRNNVFLEMQRRYLQKDPGSFELLRQAAILEGKRYAKLHKDKYAKEVSFLSVVTPWPNYADSEELQRKFPVFSFTKLHPEFHKAFVDSYRTEAGITGNVYYRSPADKPLPYFLAITISMIWDQMDVAQGKNTEQRIAYKRSSDLPIAFTM